MCCNGLSDLAILIRYRSRTLVCLSVCRMQNELTWRPSSFSSLREVPIYERITIEA